MLKASVPLSPGVVPGVPTKFAVFIIIVLSALKSSRLLNAVMYGSRYRSWKSSRLRNFSEVENSKSTPDC